MNIFFVRLLSALMFSFLFYGFSAAQKQVENLGFENGNFDGWVGYQWRHSDASDVSSGFNTLPAEVVIPTSRRHVIISDKNARDYYTGNALKKIPDGYDHSARLGCDIIGADPQVRCWQQSLRHTMKIDSSNAFLLLKFALVLQYSTHHDNITEMEPHFQLSLYDNNDDLIDDCSNYDVFSSGSMDAEFHTYTPPGANEPIKWRDWTTVGADLTTYIGQEITIEFLSADCTGHRHFGYVYFVVDCMPLYVTVDYCTDDSVAVLEAPEGFARYRWLDADSATVIENEQDLTLSNPEEGAKYFCTMESETGCSVSLSSVVARYEPHAVFSSQMLGCESNEVEFTNQSTYANGNLQYLWDFGDGNTSREKNPVYRFESSGIHKVGLILFNPPSGCSDTVFHEVESFSKTLVGIEGDSTYCPGLETELEAFGASSYQWNTGESSSLISVGNPGGKIWLLGRSTNGCVSDTLSVNVTEEPDWDFSLNGDSTLCEGSEQQLNAFGAVDYTWNTGSRFDAITIQEEGQYSVTGLNERGCSKQLSVDVREVSLPDLSFSLSTYTVDSRNNEVLCRALSKDSVEFWWDMGDGTEMIASEFTHYYAATSDLITYYVNVSSVNQWGCISSKAAEVVVELFVPNVFTPNGDGVNDLFMPGYDLKIVDRYGIPIYSGLGGWDGTYQGSPTDPDTYFYVLNYLDAYQQEKVKKGFTTLVR